MIKNEIKKITPKQLTKNEDGIRTAECPKCKEKQYFTQKEAITGGTYNCAGCWIVYKLEPIGFDTNYSFN